MAAVSAMDIMFVYHMFVYHMLVYHMLVYHAVKNYYNETHL